MSADVANDRHYGAGCCSGLGEGELEEVVSGVEGIDGLEGLGGLEEEGAALQGGFVTGPVMTSSGPCV